MENFKAFWLLFFIFLITLGLIYTVHRIVTIYKKSFFVENKITKEKDVLFSNTLYVCKNTQCERKFFRVYQVFEQLKYGLGNENEVSHFGLKTELHIVNNKPIETFEKNRLFVCPTCQKKAIERTKEFDWMKEAPDFPKLNTYELKEYRKTFEKRKLATHENIKEIEKIIEEKESLEAFQWQYKLDDSFNTGEREIDSLRRDTEEKIFNMKNDIIAQLHRLKEGTPFLQEKRRLIELISRVEKTAEERYKSGIKDAL